VLDDFRHTLRSLSASPGFTVAVISILAIGIGASIAVFAVIDSVLLRPLPYDAPEQVVMVWETSQASERDTVTSANIFDWREQNESFEALAGFDVSAMTLSGSGAAERFRGAIVMEGFFDILRAKLAFGRFFAADEFVYGRSNVVILGHDTWRIRFGANPSILGDTLVLDGEPRTVVGVLEPGFGFAMREVAIYVPMTFTEEWRNDRKWHWAHVLARIEDGVTLERAQADMESLATRLTVDHPEWMTGWGVRVVRFQDDIVRNAREPLLLLMGAIGVVLWIACANVATLLLARGDARTREFALRAALGAGTRRLARILLVESTLLATAGTLVGFFLAWFAVSLVLPLMPLDLPRPAMMQLNGAVVLFSLLVALATGIGFGLVPARHASNRQLFRTIASGDRNGAGRRSRLQRALVVFEVALSLVLLMATGLLLSSFLRVIEVDLGFDPSDKVAVTILLPQANYPEVDDQVRFFTSLKRTLGELPAVLSVETTTSLPLNPPAGRTQSILVEGRPPPTPGEESGGPHQRFVTDGFFRTMGIPLLRGRVFSDSEANPRGGVLVINDAMATRFWPDEDPIGQRLRFEPGGPLHEVVGIVSDTRDQRIDRPGMPAMYAPVAQREHPSISWSSLILETNGLEPGRLSASILEVVAAADPGLGVYEISTMEAEVENALVDRRIGIQVLSVFAIAAMGLAAIGVYSVMRYDVGRRTREVAVRMAFGASANRIVAMVVAQTARTVAMGLAVGAGLCFSLKGLIESRLFDVRATDPATLAAASVTLLVAALGASYFPARRAAKTAPTDALKQT